MRRRGCFSLAQSNVQIPVGPAPISSTVSSGVISEIRAAQKPVPECHPRKVPAHPSLHRECGSIPGRHAAPARIPPVRRRCGNQCHPPSGSSQLFTYPCWQKKHSPQKVSTLTVTRSPGFTVVTSEPTFSTMPTISCPTVIPGTARGTLPCLMCKSLVQILPNVTRTRASSGLSVRAQASLSVRNDRAPYTYKLTYS